MTKYFAMNETDNQIFNAGNNIIVKYCNIETFP